MSFAGASKRRKLATHGRDPSKFQNSVVHKYLGVPDIIDNLCHCTFCLEHPLEYRVEHSKYQDLYPFGLAPSAEELASASNENSTSTSTEDSISATNEDSASATTEDTASTTIEDIPLSSVVVLYIEMAPASNEEQFKFLISCIRHSNNGKVDFTDVAKECGIVSKGAAAKRYERMMKANGIHQSQSGSPPASSIRDTPIPSPRRKASPSAGPSNKKRKLDKFNETTSNLNTDDDEGLSDVKAEPSTTVKAEPVKAEPVKEESTGQESNPDSTAPTETFQYPAGGAMGFDGANDSSLFDDFRAFGGGSGNQSNGSEAAFDDGQGLHESILITD